jgi:fatty acid desaturase
MRSPNSSECFFCNKLRILLWEKQFSTLHEASLDATNPPLACLPTLEHRLWSGKQRGVLRFEADRRTVATLAAYAALLVGAWTSVESAGASTLMVSLLSLVSLQCAVIAHNVVHCPVFKVGWMNQAFQLWVSLSYGFPISDYIPGHTLSHHRLTQRREDVMRNTKVRFRWNLLNLFFFFIAVTPAILRGNALYKKRANSKVWRRQLLRETVVVWGLKLMLTALDWRRALLFVWIPHLVANWGIVTINFLQHDGCDAQHPTDHSRNFVGSILNFFAFNNGYHGIHHMEPGLHWSELPQAHAALVKPHLFPSLEQPSLPRYLFQTFVWPGVRVDYRGQPLHVPPDQGDVSWVQSTNATT